MCPRDRPPALQGQPGMQPGSLHVQELMAVTFMPPCMRLCPTHHTAFFSVAVLIMCVCPWGPPALWLVLDMVCGCDGVCIPPLGIILTHQLMETHKGYPASKWSSGDLNLGCLLPDLLPLTSILHSSSWVKCLRSTSFFFPCVSQINGNLTSENTFQLPWHLHFPRLFW